MKIFFVLFIPVLFLGCSHVSSVSATKPVSNLAQTGVVERSVDVKIDQLWNAAVFEFRSIDIVDSDRDRVYIKGVDKGMIIEFTALSQSDRSSKFSIKAVNAEGLFQPNIANKFSRAVYKRAKSFWFSFRQSAVND